MKATVTNTKGIVHLALNASGRNRSVYEDRFIQAVDPDGFHVLGFQMLHNDIEMRTQWFCKMKDTDKPAEIWLDVDFDVLERSIITIDEKEYAKD